MEGLRTKSSEGIRAYVNALEDAAEVLRQGGVDGLESIGRILRSLQNASFVNDPELARLLHILQKNKEKTPAALQPLIHRLNELAIIPTLDPPLILLVEDDALTARLVQKGLSSASREIHLAPSLKEARSFLKKNEVALILLDIDLIDGDGRDLLLEIRQLPATAKIPVIMLSSHRQPEIKTECFALGAEAYFEKPLHPATLSAAVSMRLQRSSDVSEQTSIDAVTRLPNRLVFQNAFARVMRVIARTQEPLSLAILDLDRFKAVNDIAGHHMGDMVLRKISTLLARTLRASDLLVRWGGEEFAILFPNTDMKQARTALQKALTTLRQCDFKTPDNRVFKMTFSAGVTDVPKGMSLEQAVEEADRYLYLAKAAGRNHVLCKEDPLDTLRKNILLVEDDDFMASLLRRFLEKEGFRIFHARDGKTARALCAQATFSLITLDVKLPDIDGFDLLFRFRQTPTLRHVPVIMLTATGDERDVIRGFQLGADDYIVKPFSPTQFLARVNRFLEKQG